MLNNMRIYKCGNFYKYISIPCKSDAMSCDAMINSEKALNKYYNGDYKRKLNNLVRCKTTISNLLLCNDFSFFVTITFNNNFNRFDLCNLRKKVNNKIRRIRQKFPFLTLQYLFVPEHHKNGAWHIHGFLSRDFAQFIYLSSNKKYLQCDIFDFFGFNNIEILYTSNVYFYVLKYICKDFELHEKGKHLYFCSQNLLKPKLIDNFIYNLSTFDDAFFDFKNDYCYLKIQYY